MHLLPHAVITFCKEDRNVIGLTQSVNVNSNNFKIKQWGSRNDLPQYREKMLMDNNIMGELITTKRAIVLGQGLAAHQVEFKDGAKTIIPVEMPTEISDWLDNSDFNDKYLEPAANELFLHGNVIASLLPQAGKITKIMAHRCRDIRAVEKTPGKGIETYIVGDWSKKVDIKKTKYTAISATPNQTREFIFHTGDKLFYDGYYCHPAYWGGEEWVDLANQIPKFHKANLANGYTIRFHIQIPKNAFIDKMAYMQAVNNGNTAAIQSCMDNEANAKKEFLTRLNTVLAGTDNASRTITTFFDHDDQGKKIEGVTIEPINFDLKDEALLTLFEKSNQANISSIGIHPTLANIETQGKLSSGSEMRNAFEFYVKTKAKLPRDILLKPFKLICKMNGWYKKYPGIHFGFEDIVLAALDDEPTGTKPVTNPAL
jgi:hypothetical protein